MDDFGINNIYTVQHVWDNVATLYPGWRTATEGEVLQLWDNAFGNKGSTWDEQYSSGYTYAIYDNDGYGSSVHQPIFPIMSINEFSGAGRFARGYFNATDGEYSYAYFNDWIGGEDDVRVVGRDWDNSEDIVNQSDYRSAMLVRNSPVPIPAAVWLFGSGLIGLASLKRRHKVIAS